VKRDRHIVNDSEIEWQESGHGDRFLLRRRQLGAAALGDRIGTSLYELPPGKASFPYHYHSANEEAIYLLEGSGTLRLGGREWPISKGDYVALPAGEECAHQVVNSSGAVLRYLCISTMIEPEVSIYPDSGKVGLFTGSAPGGDQKKRTLTRFIRPGCEADYWEGE